MSYESKRERIILSDIELLENIPEITTVKRTIQTFEELKNFAITQFPVVAVVGGLPKPINKTNKRNGEVDQIISVLEVNLFVYFQENDDMDSEISNLLEEIWVKLYENQSRNGLCLSTTLEPEPNQQFWSPFVAFNISIKHEYCHDTEGI